METEWTARCNARRSVVATCDIKKGTILTEEMLTFKRPGTGIPASELDRLIGKSACVDIKEDTIIQEKYLK